MIAAFAAAMMLSPAAFAQSGNQTKDHQGAEAQMSAANAQTGHPGSQNSALTQAQLDKALQQAGFKNIKILDSAYLVQAQTKDGQNVVMMVNPPELISVTGATPGSGNSASAAGNSGSVPNSGSSQSGSGSSKQ